MHYKKVSYEEPLTEGEVPKTYVRIHGEIYECIPDDDDIGPYDPEEHETDRYIIDGKEEFYDYVTICKACECQFIAFDKRYNLTRYYCPHCGKKLVSKEGNNGKT